jgi:GT2 family glycosyltransferase
MSQSPRISVVIPSRNGAKTLATCLSALRRSSFAPCEIILVDDASTDNTAHIAKQFDCRVIRLDKNIGAARAKNRGAQDATGDVLFFTDDDVIVAPDALGNAAKNFAEANLAGIVGLLDAKIPFDDFPSNFKNLWMRYSYERIPREKIGLFYTSIAAMRREVFQSLGGFDSNYVGASIAEDTEFGQRAWAAGHYLRLDPTVTAVHHKHYTPSEVFRTDYLRARALMLMRLRKWGQPFYTSVPTFYQLAVPVMAVALGLLFLGIILGHWSLVIGSLISLIAFYVLNFNWLTYLARQHGIAFGLLGIVFQTIDVIVVGFGMAIAILEFILGKRY